MQLYASICYYLLLFLSFLLSVITIMSHYITIIYDYYICLLYMTFIYYYYFDDLAICSLLQIIQSLGGLVILWLSILFHRNPKNEDIHHINSY